MRLSRSALLFWGLIALCLIAPIASAGSLAAQLVVRVLVAFWLASAVYAVSYDRWHLRVGLTLAALNLAAAVYQHLSPTRELLALNLTLAVAFYTFVAVALIGHVRRARRVTADTLYSACSTYILFAIAFAALYLMVELAYPGSFQGKLHPHVLLPFSFMDAVYFSMTTLTTAGYGDIAPVQPLARSLVMLEQVLGVLYPTILISRLVSVYVSSEQ